MAAQISQFSRRIQRKMIKSFSEQNGGSVRAQSWPEWPADWASLTRDVPIDPAERA